MRYSLERSIDLRPGDHLCCFYETDEERRVVLAMLLLQGLERGEKACFIGDMQTSQALLDYMGDDGFEVSPYLSCGQLGVMSFDETYLREGVFDPDKMIDLLKTETDLALAQGYRALRVTGDMSWALQTPPGSEQIIKYEAKLNEFFPGSKCIGICQYDKLLFPPALLMYVLETYPLAIIRTELFDNFYYIPPEDLLRSDPQVILGHMLHNLKEHKRAKEKIRIAYEELKQIFNTATDGMRVIDQEFNILRINTTFSRLTGISEDEAVGKKCYEVFGGPVCHTPNCTLTRVLGGEKLVEFEVERQRSDGTRVPCIMRAAPIQGPDGDIIGIVEDFKDISEQKLMQEHLRVLPQKLLQAQEKARQRIARDLHDQIAQDLFTVKIACETLFDDEPAVPSEKRHRLLDLTRMVQGSVMAVRNLAYDLCPPGLDQSGLVRTVYQYCQDFSDRHGVSVDFYAAGLDGLKLDFDTEINLYRLVQEALNNVNKHANAKHVTVRMIASSPNIVLRIEDDGKGFDVNDRLASAVKEKRLGLRSMEERVCL
ncbi:MAG: MEDS domain-containing protein, partial [Deltaproteobacteria bacterium]|nr:MEDS domain-containing protein [Deltaproteobacteria bacterium]